MRLQLIDMKNKEGPVGIDWFLVVFWGQIADCTLMYRYVVFMSGSVSATGICRLHFKRTEFRNYLFGEQFSACPGAALLFFELCELAEVEPDEGEGEDGGTQVGDGAGIEHAVDPEQTRQNQDKRQ